MKNIFVLLLVGVFKCSFLFAQITNGALINSRVVLEYGKGSEAIKNSILMNINNFNLLEYSYALPELYELFSQGTITENQWRDYIVGLQNETLLFKTDTLQPLFASQFKGIIPMQFRFFEATLDRNIELKNKFPSIFELLKKYRIDLKYGYKMDQVLNLINISDVVGETNFWYFLQVEGCSLLNSINSNEKLLKKAKAQAKDLLVTSNYKTPYYLQIRKLKDLQYRLLDSNEPICIEFSKLLNSRIIAIEDNNKSFFVEHPDWDLLKEF